MPSPALLIPSNGLGLNSDQIRETLNYFRKYNTFCLKELAPKKIDGFMMKI